MALGLVDREASRILEHAAQNIPTIKGKHNFILQQLNGIPTN